MNLESDVYVLEQALKDDPLAKATFERLLSDIYKLRTEVIMLRTVHRTLNEFRSLVINGMPQ